MRKTTKIIALFLVVATLASVLAISVSAVGQGYPMSCTIYYKDESGNTLANTKTFQVNASDESAWSTGFSSPTIGGYALKYDSDSFVTYEMMDKYFPASNYVRQGSATYTVYYVKTYTHSVYYMYGVNTRPAATATSKTGKPGTSYSFTSPKIMGYSPTQSTVSGTIGSSNSSTTVYYYPYTYTVSYNANGGSGAPASQTKTYGVNLTLSSTIPTKSGYTFAGWATSPVSSNVAYSPGGTYAGNSNMNLYAVWTQNSTSTPSTPTTPSEPSTPSDPEVTTYTVTYHANGGSGAPSPQIKNAGEKIIISSVEPTRTGYTFSGWALTSTSTYPSYTAGGTYSKDADLDLYAIWLNGSSSGSTPSEPRTCTVTYNANGGSGAPASQSVTPGSKLTLSSTIPRKSGYNFKGWATKSWATSATYQPGTTWTITTNMTLYAVWQGGGTYFYTVTFDANGGSGAPDSITADYGETITIPDVEPYRSGYNFINWENVNTSEYYYPGASMAVTGTTTLTAVWYEARWDDDPFGDEPTVPTTYTVSYNANGGTGAPSSQTKTQGIDLRLSSVAPTRSGYAFTGWSISSSFAHVYYTPGEYYTEDANLSLFAVWESTTPTTYTISYNASGGTGAPSSQVKTHGVALTLSSVRPSRTGYTFIGWSTSSTIMSTIYQPGGSYTDNASVTLYAVWATNTYTVSYNANGGTGAPSSQTKTHGVTLTLSSTKPTKTGYTFLGWSTSSTATSATYSAGGSYTANASATLYAVWSTNTYTVSYNSNGGSNAPAAQSKTHGTPITLSTSEPTRNGYLFLGWSTSSTATSPTYLKGATYSDNASVTLYAVWIKINYDFTVSNLIVTPSEVSQYETINIRFRLDSNDKSQSRNGVPVTVYFGGELVYSSSLNFTANGVNYVNFDLNVGNALGDKTVEARINWSDHLNETNTADNSAATTVNVKFFSEMSASVVSVDGKYIEGTEVITSFFAENGSSLDTLPDSNVKFDFEVYELNGSSETLVISKSKDNIVIPANGSNLVYFKWTIPSGSAGKTYMVKGTVNGDNKEYEDNADNNSAFFTLTVSDNEYSQTPDTRYERKAPSTYITNVIPPYTSTGVATWNEWEYDALTNALVLKKYGISVSNAPTITPDSECKTATKSGGVWTMKSGYGITVTWSPTTDTLSGYLTPKNDAITKAQTAFALFPEFAYSNESGYYRTLDDADGTFEFVENTDAVNNARVHFIPIYVKNGEYVVSFTASQIWTPTGMITVTQNANTVRIDGTIYDDWAKE